MELKKQASVTILKTAFYDILGSKKLQLLKAGTTHNVQRFTHEGDDRAMGMRPGFWANGRQSNGYVLEVIVDRSPADDLTRLVLVQMDDVK